MKYLFGVTLTALLFVCQLALGQGNPVVEPTLLVAGLTRPTGIALQPETGMVFVADSGAGRIYRIVDSKLEVVIQGPPTESSGEADRKVDPLSLVFVDKQTLAVGVGGYQAGDDAVRIFKLPVESTTALNYETGADTKLKPVASKKSQPVSGDLSALAIAKHGLYVVSGNGLVLKAGMKGTKFSDLEPVIKIAHEAEGAEVSTITLSSRGEVVLGVHSSSAESAACKLAFYSAKTNEPLLQLATGLRTISALAYSPKTGLLYALGSAADEPTRFDLYRLDSDTASGQQRIKATKIAALDQPAAMVFDKDGTAYITVQGKSEASSDKPSGSAVKIGGL